MLDNQSWDFFFAATQIFTGQNTWYPNNFEIYESSNFNRSD